MAALHTRMSIRPHSWRVRATRFSSCAWSEMRAVTAIASPPFCLMPSATSSQGPWLRPDIVTLAPASANPSAIARPIPRDEPVTTATFPVRSNSFICSLSVRVGQHAAIGSVLLRPSTAYFARAPRPHWLEGVAVLGAPQGPVAALPGALAHIVADRPAEDAAERVALREMLCRGADDRDEFGFVLHELAGVFRDDDRLAMRNERVVGAVADIGLFRQFRLAAELFCRLGDVLGIVEPGGIERLRHDRHEEFDIVELVLDPRRLIPGERIAGDLDDLVALDDAVMLA